MIKKQLKLVQDKIKDQAKAVFGEDGRQNSHYREYLEHLFSVQTFTSDREVFMLIVTLSHRALYDIWKESGQKEVWYLISDGKACKTED